MTAKKISIICLCYLFIIPSAYANESTESEDLMKKADDFSACSGKYQAFLEQFEKEKMPAEVLENFRGNMRGAKVAAAVIIKAARNEEKSLPEYFPYIESIANPYKQRVALSFLDSSIRLEDLIAEELAICLQLNPLQAKILNDLRKQTYLK